MVYGRGLSSLSVMYSNRIMFGISNVVMLALTLSLIVPDNTRDSCT